MLIFGGARLMLLSGKTQHHSVFDQKQTGGLTDKAL